MQESIHEEEDGNNIEGFKIPKIPKYQIHNEREFMGEIEHDPIFDSEIDFNELTTEDIAKLDDLSDIDDVA